MSRFALAAAAALLLAPAAAVAQSDLPITEHTLPNGLHVIVIENRAVPLVTIEVGVRNGAFTETPAYDGLSHLYEHMFFKANRTIPDQEAFLRRMNQLGASFNATTSEEYVNYFMTVGVDSLVPGLHFMHDAILFPLFQQEELVRERPVITGEFDRAESTPSFNLNVAMDTLLWTPAYYSRKNVIGNREVILAATREQMQEIQNRYYVPNNAALILAGDITPERGFALAAGIFGMWPRGPDPFAVAPVPPPPALTQHHAVVIEQPVDGVTLRIRWQGPSVDEDPAATHAADLLSVVLANPASRFRRALVDSRVAFTSSLSYYTQHNVGPVTAAVTTSPENVLAARDSLLAQIAAMTDENYFTDAELEDARRQIAIQSIQQRERASAWASAVGFWWSVAGLDYYRNYIPDIQRQTRADLARFVRTYVHGRPYVIGAMLSPPARAETGLSAVMLLPGGGQ